MVENQRHVAFQAAKYFTEIQITVFFSYPKADYHSSCQHITFLIIITVSANISSNSAKSILSLILSLKHTQFGLFKTINSEKTLRTVFQYLLIPGCTRSAC